MFLSNDSSAGAPARCVRGAALALVTFCLAGAAHAGTVSAAAPAPRPALLVPSPPGDDGSKEGRAALSELSSAKRAAQKLEGAARTEALAAVAERYSGFADAENWAGSERAEAAFRGGEVLRTLDRKEQADGLFKRAVELGEETEKGREFAARGLLERAHIRRRGNEVEGALALYAEVIRRFADQRRTAAYARTWSGKLQLKAGKLEEAAAHMLGFAEAYPEFSVEAVRNADLLAIAQAEAGDEAAARETVERVKREVQPALEKGGKQGDAVQAALDGLRVTELLAGY